MLQGRAVEQAEISRLLSSGTSGSGGALVLRGEPGIGKSSLLRYARERAREGGMRVLEAAGAEAESAMAYAALHQLLLPLLEQVARLPPPQARALRVAFGVENGEAPDRFLVSLATLTLLSEAAGGWPLLGLVDDAHWADRSSVEVLSFVARRLQAEPVTLLLSWREAGDVDFAAAGVPELLLRGLDATDAETLLERHWPNLGPAVRRQLVAACGGNPLALLEAPRDLNPGQLAGRQSLDDPVPIASRLERAFLQRVRTRDPAAQRLLLLAAADGAGRLATIRNAAGRLGLDPSLLEGPELADLVSVQRQAVAFRHPLLRSAVYYGAGSIARRAVHRALAGAAGDAEPERRAWHLAHAVDGPNAPVAEELERSAARALRRSGCAAASAALEQAAELSVSDGDRARRLVAAAAAGWRGGDEPRASALLDAAERLDALDAAGRLDVLQLRGTIEMRAGSPQAGARLLATAAAEATGRDPAVAVPILVAAVCAAYHAGDLAAVGNLVAIAGRLRPPADSIDAVSLRLLSAALRRSGAGPQAAPPGDEDFSRLEDLEEPVQLLSAGELALGCADFDLARALQRRAVARARALGAAGSLAWALENLTVEEFSSGHLALAEAYAQEGRRLALEAGYRNSACRHLAHLAQLAAVRDRDEEATRLAEQVLAEATARQLGREAASAQAALGMLALGAGRASEALDRFEQLWSPRTVPRHEGVAITLTPDLVEAAVRAGLPRRGRDPLRRYLTWAASSRLRSVRALAARCRALLATGAETEPLFLEALRLHGDGRRPLESARTELLYGEFLRRERRRVDARQHLRSALEAFERLGLAAWAERARVELRASGERARSRRPDALDQLTPQELQIIRSVAEGATNREVAAQIFISPRTVAYHLRNVFAKLGISSRSELIRMVHSSGALAQWQGQAIAPMRSASADA